VISAKRLIRVVTISLLPIASFNNRGFSNNHFPGCSFKTWSKGASVSYHLGFLQFSCNFFVSESIHLSPIGDLVIFATTCFRLKPSETHTRMYSWKWVFTVSSSSHTDLARAVFPSQGPPIQLLEWGRDVFLILVSSDKSRKALKNGFNSVSRAKTWPLIVCSVRSESDLRDAISESLEDVFFFFKKKNGMHAD